MSCNCNCRESNNVQTRGCRCLANEVRRRIEEVERAFRELEEEGCIRSANREECNRECNRCECRRCRCHRCGCR